MSGYSDDLAYIHDVGFSDYAVEAGRGLLDILRKHGVRAGSLVVDLGCGSGVWAARLLGEGYAVIGVDISEPMIALARANAPGATFERASLFDYTPPACDAVTCMGECMNYTFAGEVGIRELDALFDRVYDALRPGGVFVFDFAEPSGNPTRQFHRVAKDWVVVSDMFEEGTRLTRAMTSFRAEADGRWRRTDETHIQRLFPRDVVLQRARAAGFRATARRSVGVYELPPAHTAVIAEKRAQRGTPVNGRKHTHDRNK